MLSRRRFLVGLGLAPLAPTLSRLARALPAAAPAAVPTAATGVTSVPVGTVFAYAGECPPGYLPCDGRLVGVKEYPALYAVLGQTYGAHPTRREFRVPDLNARHTHGAERYDDRHRHTWTVEALPNHAHSHSITGHAGRLERESAYHYVFVPTPRYVVKV